MTAKTRKYHYTSRSTKGMSTSSRAISGENLSKALDKALNLYKNTWGEYQDDVELKFDGTYVFN